MVNASCPSYCNSLAAREIRNSSGAGSKANSNAINTPTIITPTSGKSKIGSSAVVEVNGEYFLITNRHVVEVEGSSSPSEIRIQPRSEGKDKTDQSPTQIDPKRFVLSEAYDIAVIKLTEKEVEDLGTKPTKIASSFDEKGEFSVIGGNGGGEYQPERSVTVNNDNDDNERGIVSVRHNDQLEPGDSGAGVYQEKEPGKQPELVFLVSRKEVPNGEKNPENTEGKVIDLTSKPVKENLEELFRKASNRGGGKIAGSKTLRPAIFPSQVFSEIA